MHSMFFLLILYLKHPVALIYHLFHVYFHLKCNLLSSHASSTHVLAVYGNQVSSTLQKLLHCMSKFHIACESDIS
jgi:hypothetical protein